MIHRALAPAERLQSARRALECGAALRRPGAAALSAALELAEAGQYAAAADSLASASGAAAALRLFRALALDAAGQRADALAELTLAVEAGLDDYDCLCLAGDALLDWDAPEYAIAAYDQAIALAPHSSHAHLRRGTAFAGCGDVGSAIRDMRRATLLQPNLAAAHVALGDEQRTAGLLDAAVASYRQALAIEPANTAARNGLESAIAAAVPPWHLAMLNDEGRAAAYDAAIRRAVRPGMHVLDIGTGSGLLAMMAARAGAARVTACESVGMLAATARRIVSANGLAERIQVVHRRSTALAPGPNERAELLVAEIVDCGLLSEGVLATIADARARLLRPGAQIIPAAASIYAVPVESAALHAELRVGRISGFDLRDFNDLAAHPYRQLDVRSYPWRPLTAPAELFRFDFSAASPAPETRELRLLPISDGTAHALVLWFRLMLDDESVIGTGPHDPPTHWKQAVFAVDPPCALNQNEPVRLTASHDGRIIRLALHGRREGPTR